MRKLFIAILIFYVDAVIAADVSYDVDIPASEGEEGEFIEPAQDFSSPVSAAEIKMQKRAAEPVADEVKDNIKNLKKRIVDEAPIPTNMVVLQGLNKVIGRVSTIEIPFGTIGSFENLKIIARKCAKSPPDARPENAALLEIRELKNGEEPKQIFFGWMMSSSPGLSSLEHPVYDITVLSCEFKKDIEGN